MKLNVSSNEANMERKIINVSVKRQPTMQPDTNITKANIERKTISISVKRQLTIPLKYYNALGFSNEAECILQEDGLLIRPMRTTADSNEFNEIILADLISQGYEGQQLLNKFKELSMTTL